MSNVTTYEFVSIERRDQVAILTLSRPEKLNALNHALLTELDHAVKALQADAKLRVIVVTGAGEKAFVAGADIGELAVLDTRGAEAASAFGSRIFRQLETGPQAVIAAVNGFALGGGCELALACHIRLASENAKFGLPEVSLGIIPGYGGTQRLARLVGPGRAIEMIASGDMIDAAAAERFGLVNRIVPRAELLGVAEAFAQRVASRGPVAVRYAIDAVVLGAPRADGLRHESELFSKCFETQDMREGTKAFLEKRKPEFKGV